MSENWNIYEIRARHERGEISDGEFARLSLNRGLGFLGFAARPAKLKLSDFTDENMDASKQLQMARACGEVFGLSSDVLNSTRELAVELGRRGLDIRNNGQMRAYLLNNRKMKH
jgi:hypothetical protein